MTVKELIEKLQQLDAAQDLPVVINDCNSYWLIFDIERKSVRISNVKWQKLHDAVVIG